MMEFSHASIKALVAKLKQEIFIGWNPYSSIATSAYDTAWLTMVPNTSNPSQPMFMNCLTWVLKNQREEGFWGDPDAHGNPTIECLPATIACMVALKRWQVGKLMIDKGMVFIEEKTEQFIEEIEDSCPRWFAIIFPAMLELAHTNGLQIMFNDGLKATVMEMFYKRQQILEREKQMDKYHYPPLLAYLETLPLYNTDQQLVINNLYSDGSLFHSPSATAQAFMATGNNQCLAYLQSLVQNCPNGVPSTYPMDEDLIKLCMVNQLQRLGLAEHFNQEIEQILEQIYRYYYMKEESWEKQINSIEQKLYKDSLAFWLLRMHGYDVSPVIFCWFLHDEEIRDLIQNNSEFFSSVMLNVHKATELMFPGEYILEEAKSFSRKLLEKSISVDVNSDQKKTFTFPNFRTMMKHELRFPWVARLDHLEHRMWIEENNITALWMGKASFLRFSSFDNEKLIQLATRNYEFRQSIYKNELEELKRWSKSWGLTDLGFGREKTTYCYFAISASTSLPQDSDIRMIVAKSAIIITVADDFYDVEGCLDDLKRLTHAVKRWDGEGLSGHGRRIFNVLDDFVREMAAKHFQQKGKDITNHLRYIWYETFKAWFTEAKWSRSGFIPSAEEYLEIAMTSIAAHTLLLHASCFLPNYQLNPTQHHTLTKLTMLLSRLLNDLQSYEKEQRDGKTNFVLLDMKRNPGSEIEDSISHVKEIVEEKRREFMKHALMGESNDLSKQFRQLHLSCLKVFQMFFDSSNRYDSNTELIEDIQKAIYLAIQLPPSMPSELPQLTPKPLITPCLHSKPPTKVQRAVATYTYHFDSRNFKNFTISYAAKPHASLPITRTPSMDFSVPLNFKPSLI